MNAAFDKLVLMNRSAINKVPALRFVATRYLLGRFPLQLADVQFDVRFANSYALISEKNSEAFKRVMRHIEAYIGTGSFGPNKRWEYPWVLATMKLAPGLRVLDAGCGTSPLQFAVARLGCEAHGVDPCEGVEWHGIDRRLQRRMGCTVQYRVEGIERLGYPDAFFDRVYCVSVLEHCRVRHAENDLMVPLSDDDRALHRRMMGEMIRVLKPGGILALTLDFNMPRDNALLESNVDVANLLSVAGVEPVASRCAEPFPGEPGFDAYALVRNSDVDVVSYVDCLQTSIGLTLIKK